MGRFKWLRDRDLDFYNLNTYTKIKNKHKSTEIEKPERSIFN